MQSEAASQTTSWHRGLLSLDPLQWIILVSAVLVAGVNIAAAGLNSRPSGEAVGRAITGLGWPLMAWGMLPKMRIERLKIEIGQFVRRDTQAMARSLTPAKPDHRDWCSYAGMTLVLGGMVLFFPVPALQICAGVLLLLFWAGIAVNLRTARKATPPAVD